MKGTHRYMVSYKCRACGEKFDTEMSTLLPLRPAGLIDDSIIPATTFHTCFKFESINAEQIGIADKISMKRRI